LAETNPSVINDDEFITTVRIVAERLRRAEPNALE
jgi:hypothetical protein